MTDATDNRAAEDIVCDVTFIQSETHRFSLRHLMELFPQEYAEAKANGLSDREFVEESIDMGGKDAGMDIIEHDWDTEFHWRKK